MLSLLLAFSEFYAQGELPEPELTAFTQGWATIYDQDESLQADPAGYGDQRMTLGLSCVVFVWE